MTLPTECPGVWCHWHLLWGLPHVLFCPFVAVHVHQSCCCADNGESSSAAPAAHPTPAGHAADPPAFGPFSFGLSSVGVSAFAGTAAFTTTFGGVNPTTDEGKGKGKATAGIRSTAQSKPGKGRVKTKAATAAVPIATAATSIADLPTSAFTFSGADSLAGKWLQVVLPLVATHFADCACAVRQCSFI